MAKSTDGSLPASYRVGGTMQGAPMSFPQAMAIRTGNPSLATMNPNQLSDQFLSRGAQSIKSIREQGFIQLPAPTLQPKKYNEPITYPDATNTGTNIPTNFWG
jgi:hypothetical protein